MVIPKKGMALYQAVLWALNFQQEILKFVISFAYWSTVKKCDKTNETPALCLVAVSQSIWTAQQSYNLALHARSEQYAVLRTLT